MLHLFQLTNNVLFDLLYALAAFTQTRVGYSTQSPLTPQLQFCIFKSTSVAFPYGLSSGFLL